MKEIVERLQKRGMLFKSLKPIDPRRLGTRKKLAIYEGVDLSGNYVAIFAVSQKSRFLRKHADEIEALYEKLVALQEHHYRKKVLLYAMPFCSKAQAQMREKRWVLIDAAP